MLDMSRTRVDQLILRAAAVAHYGAPAAKIAASIADVEHILGGATHANIGQMMDAQRALTALRARPEVSWDRCPTVYTVKGARSCYRISFAHIGICSIAQITKV